MHKSLVYQQSQPGMWLEHEDPEDYPLGSPLEWDSKQTAGNFLQHRLLSVLWASLYAPP